MKKRIISFLLVVFMLFSVVGCADEVTSSTTEEIVSSTINIDSFINNDGTVTMPDLTNYPLEEARNILRDLGLRVRYTEEFHTDDIGVGNVIKADWEPGDVVRAGTQIVLTIRKEGNYIDPDVPYVDPLVAEREKLSQGGNSDYVPLNYDVMKAVWISQFDLSGVLATGVQVDEAVLREKFGNLCKKLQEDGYNTVIVQVRPYGDSFYPSEYYPWSKYAVGGYGIYAKYDPLKIMIEEAHKYSLSFQARINPMRAFDDSQIFNVINVNYPLRQWYDNPKKYPNWIYHHGNYFYLNVAYEEVRQLIIDGAAEIVRYYDVDGIHMDDYFYPSGIPNAFDNIMFSQSKFNDRTKFRQDNINKLVKGLYSAVKSENSKVLFGISPAGNIDNVRKSCCLDIDTILSQKGYVDYIMPQIYWGFEHSTQPYKTCLARWQSLVKEDSIKFIVGLTASNIASPTGEFVNRKDVFKRYLEHAQTTDKFDGLCIFSVADLYSMSSAEMVSNTDVVKEMKNFLPLFKALKSDKVKY